MKELNDFLQYITREKLLFYPTPSSKSWLLSIPYDHDLTLYSSSSPDTVAVYISASIPVAVIIFFAARPTNSVGGVNEKDLISQLDKVPPREILSKSNTNPSGWL